MLGFQMVDPAERKRPSTEDPVSEGANDASAGEARKRGKIVRVMLTVEQAKEIYERRPHLEEILIKAPGALSGAQVVAKDYDVSAKTIRDIWNRYSWAKATQHLWTEREKQHFLQATPSRGHQAVVHISQDAASEAATLPNTPPSPTLTAVSSTPSSVGSRGSSAGLQPQQTMHRPDPHMHDLGELGEAAQQQQADTHLKIFGSGMTFEILKRNTAPTPALSRFTQLPNGGIGLPITAGCDPHSDERHGHGGGDGGQHSSSNNNSCSSDFSDQMNRILGGPCQPAPFWGFHSDRGDRGGMLDQHRGSGTPLNMARGFSFGTLQGPGGSGGYPQGAGNSSSPGFQSMMQQVLGYMQKDARPAPPPERPSQASQLSSQLDLDVELLQGQIDEAQMRLNQLIRLKLESKQRLQQQQQQQRPRPHPGLLEQQQQHFNDITTQLHNLTNGLCFPC